MDRSTLGRESGSRPSSGFVTHTREGWFVVGVELVLVHARVRAQLEITKLWIMSPGPAERRGWNGVVSW